jgi:O-acetyl-ADP-ribose deacetylase (regulator of RNase III)
MSSENKYYVHNTIIVIKQADLTGEDADTIVNAANSHLQHGGGLAGAIVRKGGRIIQDESDRIGYVPVGQAVMTSAGRLMARHVIHAVGPMMGEGNEDEKLRNATQNSLALASTHGFHTLAFPAISTGIFGYPIDRCAEIMLKTTAEFCQNETTLTEIRFCLFDDAACRIFRTAAVRLLQNEDQH